MTERCLFALGRQTLAHRVIVVDNASPDDSVAAIRAGFPDVEVLALGTNRGYAAACNAGIMHGSGSAIVLLNNDVIAPSCFLERLLAPMDADTHVGSVASVLLRPGADVIDSAGLSADPTLAGFPRLQGQSERSATTRQPLLLGPTGAAGAFRRDALSQVGGLDERIFLYNEDVDLALRLCAAGWATALAHDARALHVGSATAGRGSAVQRRHAAAARAYLLRRYGIVRGIRAPRVLATEAMVVAGDAVLSRDLAALHGRLAGWRAASRIAKRQPPADGLDSTIGFLASLRLRRADRALAASTPIAAEAAASSSVAPRAARLRIAPDRAHEPQLDRPEPLVRNHSRRGQTSAGETIKTRS